MDIRNEERFIKGVESLIDPMEVSNILFIQKIKGLLPARLLKWFLYRASKKTPYIGFAIDPYSLFLFFKLKDIEQAKSLLPERYELARTALFVDDEPQYYLGIGNLNTRASTFWGTRQEVYLIATDKETGLISFIFLDILSNTIIAHPTRGISDPNCSKAIFTTNSRGDVFLDIEEIGTGRRLALKGNVRRGKLRQLDQPLWLLGNTSIGHSRKYIKEKDHPFAVIFDPAEVFEALDIPVTDISISANSLFPGLADDNVSSVICFPFSQHYIADSPGHYTTIKDSDDLINQYNKLAGTEKLSTFSSRKLLRLIVIGIVLTALLTISVIFLT